MKKTIAFAALLTLSGCNQADTDDTTAQVVDTTAATDDGLVDPSKAGFEAVAPGDYEVTRTDGSVDHLTVHPGMIWSRVNADGSAAGGTIFAQGGKTCFVTEGVEGHRCFSEEKPAADGSMKVTGEDGETAMVRPAKTRFAT
jgi:hypothetical protein